MPVKPWSAAGLILTYWCNGRCASCYLCCGPDRSEAMTVEQALGYWRSLQQASPHGCRIHLTGGEPFGDWPMLIELARRAKAQQLGPLEKVETNAFWADDAEIVRQRVGELDAAGMRKLVISADPYHQAFVPMARVHLAATVAEEVLGADRVQVRWRDWLADGFDTDTGAANPDGASWDDLAARWAATGRDRLTGRAADRLAPYLQLKPLLAFADNSCRRALLRSKHVHIDPAGRVIPGTCAGLVLGDADEGVAGVWRKLQADHAARPVLGALVRGGPVALLPLAEAAGFTPADGYAGKCHLCWSIRRHLAGEGLHADELDSAGYRG